MNAHTPTLPVEAAKRKAVPIATGVVDYFPDALAAIAELSRIGNEQHNPGKPLHWDRSKSTDEGDALMRHFVERGTVDTDGVRHSTKAAWRALALLQKEIEQSRVTAGQVIPLTVEPGETFQQAADRALRVFQSNPLRQWRENARESVRQTAQAAQAEREPAWKRAKVGDRIRIAEGSRSLTGVKLPTDAVVYLAEDQDLAPNHRLAIKLDGSPRNVSNDDVLAILSP